MTGYPLTELDQLPFRLAKQPGRWAVIADGQLAEDEANRLRDVLRAMGLEARCHLEPTGWKTLARVAQL